MNKRIWIRVGWGAVDDHNESVVSECQREGATVNQWWFFRSYVHLLAGVNYTTIILVFVCRSGEVELVNLYRRLMEVGIPLTRSLEMNRPEDRRNHLLMLADVECPNSYSFLQKVSDLGLFNSPYRWIWLRRQHNLSRHNDLDFQKLLEELNVLVDSQVALADRTDDAFEIVEVYKVAPGLEIIEQPRGTWRPGSRADLRQFRPLVARRRDLRRHTITMANVVVDSNATKKHLNDRLDLKHDSITKISWAAGRTCIEMLNATPRAVFAPTWGYKDKDGNWNGMIHNFTRKEADIGTLTIFTKERSYLIKYIAMIGSTSVRFVFRQPPLSYVSNIYSLPFSSGVWLSILVCALASAAVLYVTSKWEATIEKHPTQLTGSWGDVLILTISAIMQQGCVLEPRFLAGRILTFFLFAVLMALYAAYSANIVVLLRAPSTNVRTLTDLLKSPLILGASDLDYNRYFFKQLNEPIRKEIYEKKIVPKGKRAHFYSMEEGVEMIRKGLFAFHMEVNPGYRLIQDTYQEDEKCDLVEIDYINEFDPWMPAQKNSPYLDHFRVSLYRYRETGLQQANHRRLIVPRPRCSGTVASFVSVGIIDTYPGLVFMLYGFVCAVLALLLEISVYHIQIRRHTRRFIS